MSEQVQVEATGETVGEAKWNALRDLERLEPGVDKGSVEFQVVSEGERGLLGVGYTPARVIASVAKGLAAPAAPAEVHDESALAAHVREVLERIVREIGVQARIEIDEREDELVAACSGRDLGMLIGKHGQTIDAVQYLINAIVWRAHPDETRKDVVVDAAGYRARRQATLEALALRSAERAVGGGEPVSLDPMTAVERKVVHVALKDYAGIETSSEGTEPNRFVVIAPTGD